MMKRRVVFSESESESESGFETLPKKRKSSSTTKQSTESPSSSSSTKTATSHADKKQQNIIDVFRKAAVSKSESEKSQKRTLDNYFSPKAAKKLTETSKKHQRSEISVDDFFGGPKQNKVKPPKTPPKVTPPYSPIKPSLPRTPMIMSPGCLIPDTPSPSPNVQKSPRRITENGSPVKTPKKNKKQKSHHNEVAESPTSPKKKSVRSEKVGVVNPSPQTPQTKKPFWAYQSREGPTALGSKPVPKGNPTCLKGKAFLITGVLESIERTDAHALIERCGGKVMKTLGKKTDYLIVGREAGEGKLTKAEALKIKQLDEDGLFDLIRSLAKEPLPTNADDLHEHTIINNVPTKENKSPLPVTPTVDLCHLTAKPVIPTVFIPPQKSSADGVVVRPFSALHPSNMLWVDKYKPSSRKTLVGQAGPKSPANRLFDWLSEWHGHFSSGAKAHAYSSAPPWASSSSSDDGRWARAALLSGPPGIGKTSTAGIVCKELGFTFCELNASDCRSKRSLQEEISQTLGMKNLSQMVTGAACSLSSQHHVLIMDEVDGMAGNEDRGGIQELIIMIKSSKIPVICMCNDRQSTKVRSLANYCFDLRFSRPRAEQIKAAVLSIACKENVSIPPNVLTEIIQASNQDIRQVINNAQLWCSSVNNETESTTHQQPNVGAQKDIRLSAFEVIRKVFTPDIAGPKNGPASINDSLDLFFQDYSLVPLFVQENFLNVKPYAASNDMDKILHLMSKAADDIAMGDVVNSAIRSAGTGSWSLLPSQAVFSVVRPGRMLRGPLPGGGPGGGVNFPSWFGKNSNQGKMHRLASELSHHLCLATHGGSANARNLILDYSSVLADSLTRPLKEGDVDSVLNALIKYQLQRDDLDSLLELATWSHRPNRMHGVDSKVKSALTRAFNKSVHLLPYASVASVKSRRKAATTDGDNGGDEDDLLHGEEDDGGADDDDVQSDAMVVHKKKSVKSEPPQRPSSSKNSSSTSKKSRGNAPSKSRGRGKTD